MNWILLVGLLQHESGVIHSYDVSQSAFINKDICEQALSDTKYSIISNKMKDRHSIIGSCVHIGLEDVKMFTDYRPPTMLITNKVSNNVTRKVLIPVLSTAKFGTPLINTELTKVGKYEAFYNIIHRDSSLTFVKFKTIDACNTARDVWNNTVLNEVYKKPAFKMSKVGFKSIAKCL